MISRAALVVAALVVVSLHVDRCAASDDCSKHIGLPSSPHPIMLDGDASATARTDIQTIETALDAFELDVGRFPTTDEGLEALVKAPADAKGWRGPYIKSVPKDPWQHAYIYRSSGKHNPNSPELSSAGPDGKEGTADDITNWNDKK